MDEEADVPDHCLFEEGGQGGGEEDWTGKEGEKQDARETSKKGGRVALVSSSCVPVDHWPPEGAATCSAECTERQGDYLRRTS